MTEEVIEFDITGNEVMNPVEVVDNQPKSTKPSEEEETRSSRPDI